MSAKISALTPAGANDAADVFPIVTSGLLNLKSTRASFFTGPAGQDMTLIQGSTSIEIDAAENFTVTLSLPQTLVLQQIAGAQLQFDVSGIVDLNSAFGQPLNLQANGGSITIDAAGGIQIIMTAGQTVFMSYDPLNAGDWVAAPTSVWEAIDRIARVVSVSGAVPIP